MNRVQAELAKALEFNQIQFSKSESGWSWACGEDKGTKKFPTLEDAVVGTAEEFDLHLVVNADLIEVGEYRFYMVGVRSECLKFIRKSPQTRTLMYPNGRLASYVL